MNFVSLAKKSKAVTRIISFCYAHISGLYELYCLKDLKSLVLDALVLISCSQTTSFMLYGKFGTKRNLHLGTRCSSDHAQGNSVCVCVCS